jgi:HD-like signal output (HDOD) protein
MDLIGFKKEKKISEILRQKWNYPEIVRNFPKFMEKKDFFRREKRSDFKFLHRYSFFFSDFEY